MNIKLKSNNNRVWQTNYLQTIGLSLVSGSVATLITHPLEFLKTIIQYRTEGINYQNNKIWQIRIKSSNIVRELYMNRFYSAGLFQLYRGLQINMMTKLSYLTIRNFVYKASYDFFSSSYFQNDISRFQKMMLAGISGGIAAYCTSPFALITIRQILDTQLKPQFRRHYNDPQLAFNELRKKRILFKGSHINALRHFGLNVTIAAPYNFLTQSLYQTYGYSQFISPISLIISSFISSLITIPLDNMRTRIMQSHQIPQKNKVNYQNAIDVIRKALKHQGGIRNLWAGFYTYYFVILAYATLTSGVTNYFTNSLKKQNKIEDWQI